MPDTTASGRWPRLTNSLEGQPGEPVPRSRRLRSPPKAAIATISAAIVLGGGTAAAYPHIEAVFAGRGGTSVPQSGRENTVQQAAPHSILQGGGDNISQGGTKNILQKHGGIVQEAGSGSYQVASGSITIVPAGSPDGTGDVGGNGGTGSRGVSGEVIARSQGCAGEPTTVSAPAATGPSVPVTITVTCPPAPGRVYYLIVQLDNVGTYQTTNYYPKEEISGSKGTYYYTFAASMGPRSIFVVSADAQAIAQLENSPANGLINGLPSGTQDASSPITTDRTF